MSAIQDFMKTVNKSSMFGQLPPEHIKTAKSERQESEKRLLEQQKHREEEQRRSREEELRRKKEDDDFAACEYEEYLSKFGKIGVLQHDNRILRNEQHVRNFVNYSGESGLHSNRLQAEIWQPGSTTQFTNFDKHADVSSPSTFQSVGDFPADSFDSPDPSPELSVDDFPILSEAAAPVAQKCPATAKPRRSRVAANFFRPVDELFVEPATTPRHKSWRDAPSAPSINDLRPDRRVIGQINKHLSSARGEFELRKDDFPPLGGKPGKN